MPLLAAIVQSINEERQYENAIILSFSIPDCMTSTSFVNSDMNVFSNIRSNPPNNTPEENE